MIRLLLPFTLGIWTNKLTPFQPGPVWVFLCLTLCVYVYAVIKIKTARVSYYHLPGVALSAVFFLLGMLLHHYHNDTRRSDHYTHVQHSKYLLLQLEGNGTIRPTSIRFLATVKGFYTADHYSFVSSGKVFIYVKSDSTKTLPLIYGDLIAIPYSLLKDIPGPANPGEFDYKSRLQTKNIFHQAFLFPGNYLNLHKNTGTKINQTIYSIQDYFRNVLNRFIQSRNETGVAEALLYGNDDDIDNETINAYAKTGTLHVLAVSGMHVGIIFWILSLLFKPLEKSKKTIAISHLAILTGLWIYSLLCGMSPSILRATVMFSFVISGSVLRRKGNIYNTLAASAFVLLCVNPELVSDPGFLLSYLAVLGIVVMQPALYTLWEPKSWMADQIWKISSVSIAAQLATSPIGLFYFHQFPTCFIFSNLIIIPLTTIILYGCIILVSVSTFLPLASLLGKTLCLLIRFTNNTAIHIQQIPYAYAEGIQISVFQSLTLYLFILFILSFLFLKKATYFRYALIALIYFYGESAGRVVHQMMQKNLTIYSSKKSEAMRFTSGTVSYLSIDSASFRRSDKLLPTLSGHALISGIKNESVTLTGHKWKRYSINQKIFLVSGANRVRIPDKEVDYLIVAKPFDTSVIRKIKARKVILTAGINKGLARYLNRYYTLHKIPVYNIAESGAFELNLKQYE